MKKLLAVVVFCLPAFGQAAYSGRGWYPGPAVYGATVSEGGPLTYSARTDNCVHGYSTNAYTVAPFYNPANETCVAGRSDGRVRFRADLPSGRVRSLPFNRLDAATTPGSRQHVIRRSRLGSYSIFVTDPSIERRVWDFVEPGLRRWIRRFRDRAERWQRHAAGFCEWRHSTLLRPRHRVAVLGPHLLAFFALCDCEQHPRRELRSRLELHEHPDHLQRFQYVQPQP